MKVLVACEFSNTVRDAFLRRGHDAYSCDLQRADHPNPNWRRHIRGDVTPLLKQRWDLVIAHPPCTYLCNCGVQFLIDNPTRHSLMIDAVCFFLDCLMANAPMVAVENPVQHGQASEFIPPYTQIIQPYQFGHPYSKKTCLWLKGLPPLQPTNIVVPSGVWAEDKVADGKDRKNKRSRTFQGIADTMADQWGNLD